VKTSEVLVFLAPL